VQDLVAALTDLDPHILERDINAKILQGFDPAFGVQIDRVDQGPVNIEDDCLGHAIVLCSPGHVSRA
jgi:hypothetical protein